MTPPPAEDLLPRLLLGPALRAQSDRRLVGLVREGYEAAFDEIMRRYAGQLRRYAGAIVGGRAEDVTQEAFSKALQAIRRNETEIELRPWLYRIVRNTALNDIRDRHPATVALADGIAGRQGVAEEVERREELGELIDRLRALPEPQRAAIVMREMEGLGHDEIASALGVSDGAARQAIHRARTALRNGLGMAVPLPLLKAMLDGSASQSAEMAVGGAGAGIAFKAATATALIAATFGAGVALHESGRRTQAIPATGRDRHALAQRSPRLGDGATDASGGGGNAGPQARRMPRQEGQATARGARNGAFSVDQGSGMAPGPDRGPGPRSGGNGGGGRQPGAGEQQPSGHDQGGAGSGPAPGDGEPSGGSPASGEDSSGGGSTSGEGGSDSAELSESTSNDGPDSGSDTALEGSSSSSSGDSGDSSGAEVFSGQTQPQP